MKDTNIDHTEIKGWGIDADPSDLPVYPVKIRNENDNKGMAWERPVQQTTDVEILKSHERPAITAVFGTPNPPVGLSGKIRRYAFKFSESSYGHWLPLLLADRVNMIEGVVDDIKSGHFPNIFSELGGKAELKYIPKGLSKKVLVGLAITAAVVMIFRRNGDSHEEEY